MNHIPTRDEIAKMLAEIGVPGEKREEKFAAIAALNLHNKQGTNITSTLEGFQEY